MSQEQASSSAEICHRDWPMWEHELVQNKRKKMIYHVCQDLITERKKNRHDQVWLEWEYNSE